MYVCMYVCIQAGSPTGKGHLQKFRKILTRDRKFWTWWSIRHSLDGSLAEYRQMVAPYLAYKRPGKLVSVNLSSFMYWRCCHRGCIDWIAGAT